MGFFTLMIPCFKPPVKFSLFCLTALVTFLINFVTCSTNTANVPAEKVSIKSAQKLQSILTTTLLSFETKPDDISLSKSHHDSTITLRAQIPKGKPIETIVWQLSTACKQSGYIISDCTFLKKQDGCKMIFANNLDKGKTLVLNVTRGFNFYSKTAKIAIILHDFNYSADQTINDFLNFPEPLSVALYAQNDKSGWISKIADEYKKEILIQIPLESEQPVPKYIKPYIIMVHLNEKEIRARIGEYIRIVPNFTGFINTFGSRALCDSRLLKIVLSEINKHHGYFIESPTAQHSAVTLAAKTEQIPSGIMQISIDTSKSEQSIVASFAHAAQIASEKGSIIIGIPLTKEAYSALLTSLPLFKHNGIELVLASEIVNTLDESDKNNSK